ncbi:hypothetical protein [Brevundimonas sp. SL130]|uniref:hypothetical protein n=1 Tax=Brevundimonas sp. SL130 TaxID=2995143 RepID=UPI00226D043A|nr:hypothetical protein [Brevundimonas sp. SL130]WAC60869.1 hypothetical protein OU998_05335 [Brevundimonas sp. SL130]
MADNVASVSSVNFFPPDPADVTPTPTPTPSQPSLQAEEAAKANNYRLTIESAENGRFVYTISDPITGKVVLKLPREVVQTLADDPSYRGGNVLKTSV